MSGNRYGYVIVFVSFIIQAIGLSIITAFSLFFTPMQESFGWTRATISLAATILTVFLGAAAIFAGWASDRFGPRAIMTAHSILWGVGLVLMSFVSRPWQLYLAWGVVCGTGASAINIVLLSTLSRWFSKSRGLMTGIVKSGAGLGMFVTPFVVTYLLQHAQIIQNSKWRSTAFILGIASTILMVVPAQFLRKSPMNETQLHTDSGKNGEKAETGLTFKQATKTRQFWMLSFSTFALLYSFQAIQLHIAPHARDMGATAAAAAMTISILGISSIVGRIGLGLIGDRFGTKIGVVIAGCILIMGLSWLLFSNTVTMLFVFASIHGLFHGGFQATTSPATASLFGTKSMGAIYGGTQFFGQLFGSLGGVVSGYIYDRLGSYHVAFLICLTLAVFGTAVLSMINSPRNFEAKGWSFKSRAIAAVTDVG